MSLSHKLLTSLGFTALLLGVGAADAMLMKSALKLPLAASVTPTEQVPTEGVAKLSGPDISQIFDALSIVTQATHEESLLQKVIPSSVPVETRVLLMDNDRIGFIEWMQHPQAKEWFTALKDALKSSFSSHLPDLIY